MKKYALIMCTLLCTIMFCLVGCGVVEEEKTYQKAYSNKIDEIEKQNEGEIKEIKYDLIYLNDDDIPELVVGINGDTVSVYTYVDGEAYAIMQSYTYGAMGNEGYEYIPNENVIRNNNADYAGLVKYVSFYKLNDEYELESYYENSITKWFRKDANGDSGLEESEINAKEEIHYYYGADEITEEEYEGYMIKGTYEFIEGSVSAGEMKEKLNTLNTL